MKFTKQQMEVISGIIRSTRRAMDSRCNWLHAVNTIQNKLVMHFQRENPNFDDTDFYNQCVGR